MGTGSITIVVSLFGMTEVTANSDTSGFVSLTKCTTLTNRVTARRPRRGGRPGGRGAYIIYNTSVPRNERCYGIRSGRGKNVGRK